LSMMILPPIVLATIEVMDEVILYRQISFDTAHIKAGSPLNATFFEMSSAPYLDGSTAVTALAEKHIIQWLLLFTPARQVLFEELGLPRDAFFRPEVVDPFYAPGCGDLDLVACPRLSPHRAVSLECKRVKVEAVNDGQDNINKLQDIAGGVHQANRLYNGPNGFFQTYLAVITEVTAGDQHDRNIPNRGVRSNSTPSNGDTERTTFRQIIEFPGRDKLHRDIGILFIEVVQPSRLSINTQATLRVCVYRRAEPRDQLESVTNRMIALIG
jgi:hypothetical protein